MNQKLLFTNNGNETIRIIVEPWAEEYLLPKNESIYVIGVTDELEDFFEIAHLPNTIVVYAGNHIRVYAEKDSTILLPGWYE